MTVTSRRTVTHDNNGDTLLFLVYDQSAAVTKTNQVSGLHEFIRPIYYELQNAIFILVETYYYMHFVCNNATTIYGEFTRILAFKRFVTIEGDVRFNFSPLLNIYCSVRFT